MELQDTLYLSDYTTKDRFTVTGNFPITISGKINCVDPERLRLEREQRQHILSEKVDTLQSSVLNYLISLSSTEFLDVFGEVYYEPISLKSFSQVITLSDNTTALDVSDLMYF